MRRRPVQKTMGGQRDYEDTGCEVYLPRSGLSNTEGQLKLICKGRGSVRDARVSRPDSRTSSNY